MIFVVTPRTLWRKTVGVVFEWVSVCGFEVVPGTAGLVVTGGSTAGGEQVERQAPPVASFPAWGR